MAIIKMLAQKNKHYDFLFFPPSRTHEKFS